MLANYIRDIGDNYHNNPFHNLHHATYVTQFAFMLIHATGVDKWLSPQQLFGVILSALVHDVDHPGNTNTFEINSLSYLSLLYNDQSVLENHHCSTAFLLMRRPTTNLFNRLSKPLAVELRKVIVSCIMATDMSVHFELVDEANRLVNETIELVEIGNIIYMYIYIYVHTDIQIYMNIYIHTHI
jgi:high affinity cGMP-specific 3',5'-cyclic phosphodiesterase 9